MRPNRVYNALHYARPVGTAAAGQTSLTLAQHARIARLPDDFRCVGWDAAWNSPDTAGPLIEDPLDHHICRLSPRGKLLNNPSQDALEEVARRREWLVLAESPARSLRESPARSARVGSQDAMSSLAAA
jgi:hypothetical protein